jgi:hypothetical protein
MGKNATPGTRRSVIRKISLSIGGFLWAIAIIAAFNGHYSVSVILFLLGLFGSGFITLGLLGLLHLFFGPHLFTKLSARRHLRGRAGAQAQEKFPHRRP